MTTMQTPGPTAPQLAVFDYAICVFETAGETTLVGKMDPQGALLVTVLYPSGITSHARFGEDGGIIGDWF